MSFCNFFTQSFLGFDIISSTVVPTKSDSDVILCLQLLSIH